MKISVLVTALTAAIAVAFTAPPADAAGKKRKQVQQHKVHKQKPAVAHHDPYEVIDFDGRVAGRDPDPFIRAMIRKDPRPWEGID